MNLKKSRRPPPMTCRHTISSSIREPPSFLHQFNQNSSNYWSSDEVRKHCAFYNIVSTHVVLLANVIVQGKSVGVHPFALQIRNLESPSFLPNVDVKYLGPAVGGKVNNSYMVGFNNYRAPGLSMLAGFMSFGPNREMTTSADKFITRLHAVYALELSAQASKMAKNYLKALNVTITYTNMRTQFKTLDNSKAERKILDYQNNKDRILTRLARGIAIANAATELKNFTRRFMERSQSYNQEKIDETLYLIVGLLDLLTTEGLEDVEVLRESTGGFGYLSVSGIPQVMEALITTRQLVHPFRHFITRFAHRILVESFTEKKKRSEFFAANFANIFQDAEYLDVKIPNPDDYEHLPNVWRLLVKRNLWKREQVLQRVKPTAPSDVENFFYGNIQNYELVTELVRNFIEFYVYSWMNRKVIFTDQQTTNQRFMKNICVIYGLNLLKRDSTFLLTLPSSVDQSLTSINAALDDKINYLRPLCEDVVDAFAFSPNTINTVVDRDPDTHYQNVFDSFTKHNHRNDKEVIDELKKLPLSEMSIRPKM
eukprot:TRINITY_DN2658_c0_g1_i4.p1 TRINITY_DN2658_c0_g1~~TRINITY_DN2658_c0_g1_i4.p1  ORF type:complete len:540 (-),score=116.91 TRINITY_DN2658_c0_g1_i4:354-1973(-)